MKENFFFTPTKVGFQFVDIGHVRESYILAGCHKNMNATQTLAASSYSNTLSDSGTRKRKVVMEISRNLLDMVRDFYSIG